MSFSSQQGHVQILLIDDDEDDFILTRDSLKEIGHVSYHLDWEMNYGEARTRIMEQKHDVYLIDYRLGELDGLTLISEAIKQGMTRPMILLTGKGDKKIDLRAMEEGAADYLVKSEIKADLLERTIRYSLKHAHAIREVKEQEEKYRKLFEQSFDAIFITDLDFTLIDANPSYCQLLKCDHKETYGKNLKWIFNDPTSFQTLVSRLKRDEGQAKDFEMELSNEKDNPIICQITMIEQQDPNGNRIGYQGIIRDMTLKKRAEEELLLAERLSMTGKLARSIAHEVRNPLTNLGLAIDQLEDEIRENSEDGKLYADIIRRNVGRIDQLITDLLNSSKLKELNKVPYPVDKLMEESIALVEDRLTLRGMKVEKSFDESDALVEIDLENMKIALVNILVNAIEAMQENNGVLTINYKSFEGSVYLRISDNGKGISEADQSLLFDPFYTKKKDGMGLGLTTTQNIINSHNGQIRVKSKVGEGTSFTICLAEYIKE